MLLVFFCDMNTKSTRGRKPVKKKDPDLEKYAKRFIEIRLDRGYTSYEIFAYDMKLSRGQYGRMEAGENFTAKTFVKYLKAVGLTHKQFFSKGFD